METKYFWIHPSQNQIYFNPGNDLTLNYFNNFKIIDIQLFITTNKIKDYGPCYCKGIQTTDELYFRRFLNTTFNFMFSEIKNEGLHCYEFDLLLENKIQIKTYYSNDLLINFKLIDFSAFLKTLKIPDSYLNSKNRGKVLKIKNQKCTSITREIKDIETFLALNESLFF